MSSFSSKSEQRWIEYDWRIRWKTELEKDFSTKYYYFGIRNSKYFYTGPYNAPIKSTNHFSTLEVINDII